MATGPRDAVHDVAELTIVQGRPRGRRYRFDVGVTLGRGRDCEISLDDPEVSRRHARVERDELGHFVLVDLESHNGTLVNDVTVQRHLLRYGDRIVLGGSELRFSRHDELEGRVLERQRHEILGRLAAGFAHDLNNALAVLTSNVGFLRELPYAERWSREAVDCYRDIQVATERSADLGHQLLDFARGGGEGQRLLDASKVIDDVVALIRRSFPRSIRVVTHVERRLPVVAEGSHLHQTLMILCVNARDAILASRKSGTLTIQASQEPGDEEIALVVQDDGRGMDAATVATVLDSDPHRTVGKGFDPGGRGIGRGLPIVADVVGSHGGTLQLTSTEERGSRFTIRLPAARREDLEAMRSTTVSRRGGALTGDGQLVWLVHGQAAVRRSLARVLCGAGFSLREAADLDEARQQLAAGDPAPDIAVAELDSPAPEDVELLRAGRSDIPVLCLSHHGGSEQRALARRAGATRLLTMPRGNRDVLDAIVSALRGDAIPDEEDTGDRAR